MFPSRGARQARQQQPGCLRAALLQFLTQCAQSVPVHEHVVEVKKEQQP